ncbi:protein of unknown function [Aminobacter niigataensis]|nr:protein of unknown function [Aminobacter niigataensis]
MQASSVASPWSATLHRWLPRRDLNVSEVSDPEPAVRLPKWGTSNALPVDTWNWERAAHREAEPPVTVISFRSGVRSPA